MIKTKRRIFTGLMLVLSLWCASLSAKPDLVSMDYPEATDITEIAQQIARWSNKNLLWDQKLSGKIKIIAPVKLSKEDAFATFLSALEALGYTTIATGEVIKIMRASEGMKSNTPLASPGVSPGRNFSQNDTLLTYVLPLRYAQATTLQSSLSRFATSLSLVTLKSSNTLIISDFAPKVARLLDIISLLDVPGQQIKLQIAPLKHLLASDAAKQLNELFRSGTNVGAGPAPSKEALGQVKIIPLEAQNALAIVAQPSMHSLVRGLLTKLDIQATNKNLGRQIHVRPLEYANAKKLAINLSAISSQQRKRAVSPGESEADSSLLITADEASNSLLITGSWEAYKAVDYVIRKLDVRKSQILLAVEILEIGSEHQFLLGTGGLGGYGQNEANGNKIITAWQAQSISPLVLATSTEIPLTPQVKAGQFMSTMSQDLTIAALAGKGVYMPGLGEVQPSALIHLIKNDADTKTLSSPFILTLDREEASLSVGEALYYHSEVTDPKGNKSKKIEKENIDMQLSLTPLLNHRQEISLRLKLEANQLIGLSPDGLPRINKKKISQALILKDGQTSVVAGLQGYSTARQSQGVPFFSDLPIIGWLFSRNQNLQSGNQLLIFVTPYSVISGDDFQRIYQQRLKESQNFWEKNENTPAKDPSKYSDHQDSTASHR